MTEKIMEDTVFKREIRNILDRIESYSRLFDERISNAEKEVEEIQKFFPPRQKILVGELVSLLKEGEPTFGAIRDAVLQMQRELERGKRVKEAKEEEEDEEEEPAVDADEPGEE